MLLSADGDMEGGEHVAPHSHTLLRCSHPWYWSEYVLYVFAYCYSELDSRQTALQHVISVNRVAAADLNPALFSIHSFHCVKLELSFCCHNRRCSALKPWCLATHLASLMTVVSPWAGSPPLHIQNGLTLNMRISTSWMLFRKRPCSIALWTWKPKLTLSLSLSNLWACRKGNKTGYFFWMLHIWCILHLINNLLLFAFRIFYDGFVSLVFNVTVCWIFQWGKNNKCRSGEDGKVIHLCHN